MIADGWCTTYTNIFAEDLIDIVGLDLESAVLAMNEGKLSASGTLATTTLDQSISFNFWDCHRFLFLSTATQYSDDKLVQYYQHAADLVCAGFEDREIFNTADLVNICETFIIVFTGENCKKNLKIVELFVAKFYECLFKIDTIYYWNFLQRLRLSESARYKASKVVPPTLLASSSYNEVRLQPKLRTISSMLLENRMKVYTAFIDLHLTDFDLMKFGADQYNCYSKYRDTGPQNVNLQ